MKESIAIVGVGCRFPGGAEGPRVFWDLLCEGFDGIREVPADRWNAHAWTDPRPARIGRSVTRRAGFVARVDGLDAGFFGLSPREAELMDPQQRMLLEVSWEALEDAGLPPDRLRGEPVGVFVGISTHDYELLQSTPEERSDVDVYTTTGSVASIAANRISYLFDFRGPSLAVDTACSSSLIAVHLACSSLERGDCRVALAGGVNALLAPMPFVAFSRMAMLSPDGRCKAFDASANGFVRAEGAGVVVLKPLSAALADGDPIYALIRATAANQDGRTNGITVPSGEAQAALVRSACAAAGVTPADVGYVEAHGTGTPVGDPIEARALGSVLGEGRRGDRPLLVGSVKTNIGHLEAGAGIAGLIKLALVLRHDAIPPNLHFRTPNPAIDFEGLGIRVPVSVEPWPGARRARLGAVNSFGFGGANAHAILEAPPRRPAAIRAVAPVAREALLPLSARSGEALRALAARYRQHLEPGGGAAAVPPTAFCAAAALRRVHHPHRLAVVARSRDELVERLGAFADGEAVAGASAGEALGETEARPVFVFCGQGPQWWGMGRELLSSEPVFRERMTECDRIMRRLGGWSLLEELSRGESDSRLAETAIAQPAIFALQVSLAALWASWGIRPAAVVGHSVGEVAAAHTAGILDLEEATRVIFHRGRTMELASERGRMLAARLSPPEAERVIAPWDGAVSVGAVNAPASVTLSGDGKALEEIARRLEREEVAVRFLAVRYAFHSRHMEPVREELLRSLGEVERRPARVPFLSTASGAAGDGEVLDAGYWWRNVRETVRFADAVDTAIGRGHRVFLEIGPHPVLSAALRECLARRSREGFVVSSLRREESERATLLSSLGMLHVLGNEIDWESLLGSSGEDVPLPSYPWQRERYWHESEAIHQALFRRGLHPLLERRVRGAATTFEGWADLEAIPWLADHRVQGRVIVPAAAFVEIVLAALREGCGAGPAVIEEMDLVQAMTAGAGSDAPAFEVRLVDGRFTISSRDGEGAWIVHARGAARPLEGVRPTRAPANGIRRRCRETVAAHELYERFGGVGLEFGPAFRGIRRVWRRDGEALGSVRLPDEAGPASEFGIHPALLDACLQVLSATLSGRDRGRLFLPVHVERLRFHGYPKDSVLCHARLARSGGNAIVGGLTIAERSGRVLLEIEGFRCQAVGEGRTARGDDPSRWIYESRWVPKPLPAAGGPPRPFDVGPPPSVVAARARAALAARQREDGFRRRFLAVRCELDSLCTARVLEALSALGWRPRRGERVVPGRLASRLGVAARHRRLFARLLGFLVEDGILAHGRGGLRVRRLPRPQDPEASWRRILARFPAFHLELSLLQRCSSRLAEVLRGEVDALELVAPEGSLAALEQLYAHAPSFADYQTAVAEALGAIDEGAPPSRRLRILEVGAGTGGTTAHVLPRLTAGRIEYVFTDVSPVFLTRAEERFAAASCLRTQLLDLERPPLAQGFEPGSFDVVLATDALHATRSLAGALAHLRELLAPGGWLVFLETDRPTRWVDLVFGLTEGWWRFRDAAERSSHPLLDVAGWRRLLRAVGFEAPAAVSDVVGRRAPGQTIFLARAPRDSVGAGRVRVPVGASGNGSGPETHAARAAETTGGDATPPRWLVLADRAGVGESLSRLLAARGEEVVTALAGGSFRGNGDGRFETRATEPDDLRELVARTAPSGVVFLWSLDAAEAASATTEDVRAAEERGAVGLLHLVRALAGTESAAPRLVVATRGSQPVGGAPVSVLEAPVWGLGRVIQNELRKLRCHLVDLDPAAAAEDCARALLDELDAADGEEVALRGGERFASRLIRSSLASLPARGRTRREAAWRVELPASGVLDDLAARPASRRRPGRGEVEIEVAAAALNFRDVMKVLGIYPIEGDEDLLLGDECAGRIVAVGPGVRGFRRGERVIALTGGCYASHLTVDARALSRVPRGLTFAEAATLPVAYLTAWYALRHLARLAPGETILVHSVTGGVGLAALHVARLCGAEVLATAGSPEKRELARSLGVRHVMDSRSLVFADEVRRVTGGRGVDVVLNSLAGEAIVQSLSVLAPHGRFLEIGKRDIYQNTPIGLRPFRKHLSFFSIDLPRVLADEPGLARGLIAEILREVGRGRLPPLPHRVFPVAELDRALRTMAKAGHVGKLVVSMEGAAAAAEPGRVRLRADATYLVTGGLGGFGLAVAEWMVGSGARSLVLVGRGGAASPEARRCVARLRRAGARVVVARADVSREEEVVRLLERIGRRLPPLRGVVHAAMVLDDAVLLQLDAARLRRVTAPKAFGAWNLHRATRGHALDFFVLFSSVSSAVGAPAQGNYVAANASLDALAHHRRSLGLPALVVNWGQIGDVGYVARHADVAAHLDRQGILPVPARAATALLGKLLATGATEVGVLRVDWQRWAGFLPAVAATPRYSALVQPGAGAADRGGASLRETLAEAPAGERLAILAGYLREQVARVLRTSPARLDADRPFSEIGVDSLVAFELLNRLEDELRVPIPPSRFGGGTTITRVAAALLDVLTDDAASPAGHPADESPPGDGERVVALRTGGAQAPLFCVHPAGGLANVYAPLAAALPGDFPVFGLQSRALGGAPEHADLASLAEEYASIVCDRQPQGPYRLLGFSLGALFAFATAAALERRGCGVAFVGLLDPDLRVTRGASRDPETVVRYVTETYGAFARWLGIVRPLDPALLDEEAAALSGELLAAPDDERGPRIVDWLTRRRFLEPGFSAGLVRRYFALFDAHVAMVEGAAFERVRAPVYLWRAGVGESAGAAEETWRRLAAGPFVAEGIAASHYELLFPPLVERLAAAINGALEGRASAFPVASPSEGTPGFR